MIELSIIIPHYNSPDTLQKLIKSIPVLPQIEVIVIDDNSDKYINELKKCMENNKERNVIFDFVDLPAKGAGAARNKGLSLATGRWVLFADADDYFVEDLWDILCPCLEKKVDAIFFPPTSVYLTTGEISDRHVHYSDLVKNYLAEPTDLNENLLRYKYWSPCSKLISKDLLDHYGIWFDEVLHANDVMFSTKVGVYLKSFYVVDQTIYVITQSDKSLTSDKSSKSMKIRSDILCNYYFFLRKHLEKKIMHQLGYTCKDFWYFVFYKCGLIEIRDIVISKFQKTGA